MAAFNTARHDLTDDAQRRAACSTEFRAHLEQLNGAMKAEVDGWMEQAKNALIGHVRYERVAHDGPRIEDYSEKHPLFSK